PFPYDAFNFPEEQGEGRLRHRMTIAVEFVQSRLGVSCNLHHTHHIGVLFVATEHFKFAVAGDKEERGSIRPYVVQRRKCINNGSNVRDTSFRPNSKVRDGVPRERDESGDTVGVNPMGVEVLLVKTYHHVEITSR